MKRWPQPRDDKTMIKELRSKIYYLRKGIREKQDIYKWHTIYKIVESLIVELTHEVNKGRDEEEEELINTTQISLHQLQCFICKKYNK